MGFIVVVPSGKEKSTPIFKTPEEAEGYGRNLVHFSSKVQDWYVEKVNQKPNFHWRDFDSFTPGFLEPIRDRRPSTPKPSKRRRKRRRKSKRILKEVSMLPAKIRLNPKEFGYVECLHCCGYGSSLKEDADICTWCNGEGLLKAEEAADKLDEK